MRRSPRACAMSAGRHVGSLGSPHNVAVCSPRRGPVLASSRISPELLAVRGHFLRQRNRKSEGRLGAWLISGVGWLTGFLRSNSPCLEAGQGLEEIANGRIGCLLGNCALPDAAAAIWRADPVHENHQRAGSASAHGCCHSSPSVSDADSAVTQGKGWYISGYPRYSI